MVGCPCWADVGQGCHVGALASRSHGKLDKMMSRCFVLGCHGHCGRSCSAGPVMSIYLLSLLSLPPTAPCHGHCLMTWHRPARAAADWLALHRSACSVPFADALPCTSAVPRAMGAPALRPPVAQLVGGIAAPACIDECRLPARMCSRAPLRSAVAAAPADVVQRILPAAGDESRGRQLQTTKENQIESASRGKPHARWA